MPGLRSRFMADVVSIQRYMAQSSGEPRVWILEVDGEEQHRCALDSQQ